jgi:Rieske Fe-S protein
MWPHESPADSPSRSTTPCAADAVHDGILALGAEAARLDRCGFLTQSMLAGAVLALASCGTSGVLAPDAPTTVGSSIKVVDYSALSAVVGIALVTVSGASLAIVRTSSTTFLAPSRVCPHEGSIISTYQSGFRCPRYGATYTANGLWVSGQRASNLRQYATTYDEATGTPAIA